MEIVKVAAEIRSKLGKQANKAARKEGKIPGVIYGGGDTIHFSTSASELKSVVYTADFKLIELEIDGNVYKCILKDISFHPVTDKIEHVDFLRLFDGVPVKIQVPVRFIGASPGVLEGGKLIQSIRKIDLKTTPENIVDHVTLDISKLLLGHSIRVRDIQPMENVQIMNVAATPVANVETPRALRSAADGEEEETDDAVVATEAEA